MLEDQKFTLTEDHVKLLRRMYVEWQDVETGAPEIDPKRPYGNSNVAVDIHEILTGEEIGTLRAIRMDLTCEEHDAYRILHRETQLALQVVLATGSFEPGDFKAEAYSARWERVG